MANLDKIREIEREIDALFYETNVTTLGAKLPELDAAIAQLPRGSGLVQTGNGFTSERGALLRLRSAILERIRLLNLSADTRASNGHGYTGGSHGE